MTIYILLVIAIAVIAYILVTDHRRLPALEAERNRLAAELDLWTTTGLHYFRAYPRFDWPDRPRDEPKEPRHGQQERTEAELPLRSLPALPQPREEAQGLSRPDDRAAPRAGSPA
jgi:hypothetical protein